jgi:hypothetical protein
MKLQRRLNRAKGIRSKSLSVMGWDDALMMIMAASSAASALNPPENNFQNPAGAGGMQGPAQTNPLQPQAQATPGQAPGAAGGGVQPIDTKPLTNLASELAKSGPPPQQQAQPMPVTQGLQSQQGPAPQGPRPQEMGPPNPATDPVAIAAQNQAATNSIWASLPQAIAAAAPLLGAGGQDKRDHAAPPTGGNLGANAMQNPARRPTIGEILNSLPRYR